VELDQPSPSSRANRTDADHADAKHRIMPGCGKAGRPSKHEARTGAPSAVRDEWHAICLLKDGSRQAGTLAGLSQKRLQRKNHGTVCAGIHVRLEVDFQMSPAVSSGRVTEDVPERHTVTIRFLEMSHRKQESLRNYVAETPERTNS